MSQFALTNLRMTDLNSLEDTYGELISHVDYDNDDYTENPSHTKFEICFHDSDSYLECEEVSKNPQSMKVDKFWYNWWNDDESLIMRFHNHFHGGNPSSVTAFDPVHLHLKDGMDDNKGYIHDHSPCQSLEHLISGCIVIK